VGGGNTGRAQFLLTPVPTTVAGGIDYVGGPNEILASNIFESDDGKNYHGAYINDDWRVTPKLTLNLGLRWDYFGLVFDHHNAQANFVPGGPPAGGPMYIIPPSQYANFLQTFQVNPTTCPTGSTFFPCLLAKDGITLAITDKYGGGLGDSQTTNFAPRFGFAYQVTPKFVARGGFGIFYNGFENRGYSPNIGENYPFQFSFDFQRPNDGRPIGDFAGCMHATPAGSPTLETGFSCTPLSPLLVNAKGLNLRGIQFDYITPYSMSGNFTLQYQLTNSMSTQVAYVTSLGRHLEVFPGSNQMPQIVAPDLDPQNFVQFPDFARGSSYAATIGSSYYHGLQTKVEKQFTGGLNFLATYTWSKVRSDALDLLNGFSAGGYRAPGVPGIGIHADYGLANFDVRNVVHLSGGYELPFGKGKRFMSGAQGIGNSLLGGWSINWASTLQGGQAIEIGCPTGTAAGLGCRAFVVPGVDPTPGRRLVNGFPVFLNPAAFRQPCKVGSTNSPNGCVPLSGVDALGGPQPTQVPGPGFHRLDMSLFKNFRLSERFNMQFRSEFFNILNHPNFNAPGFGGNGVVSIPGSTNFTPNPDGTFGSGTFGMSGSTRDAPYDPRQIQFALKLLL
jgi:hypothetical protein